MLRHWMHHTRRRLLGNRSQLMTTRTRGFNATTRGVSLALGLTLAYYQLRNDHWTRTAPSNATQQQQQQQKEEEHQVWAHDDETQTATIENTLEAITRALRLFTTAIVIISDYQSTKYAAKYLPSSALLYSNQEQLKLEQERDECQQALRAAQLAYTSPIHPSTVPSKSQRQELKRQQKAAMEQAAENLAHVEQKLAQNTTNVHYRAAQRLLQLCRTNGGAYIKIGQHLANLDYLIPQEYIQVLSSLFDDTPRSSFENVCKVIQQDLGQHPDNLFINFEKEPVASASLAQVHVAYDKETGRKLAVKVQHYNLRETSRGDLMALRMAVSAVEYFFRDDYITWAWIVDEIAPHLPKELDFIREGQNAERAARHLSAAQTPLLDVVIPKILWQHSSSRVLCMEYEEGFKATDVQAMHEAGLSPRDVSTLISSVFNYQIFMTGFVHCDPHPANTLVRRNKTTGKPQLVLVDHGLYRQVDDEFRIQYARLWQSLFLADLRGIEMACAKLGITQQQQQSSNVYSSLLASILTGRPYDEMMERAKTQSLEFGSPAKKKRRRRQDDDNEKQDPRTTTNNKDAADRAMIQGYARQFMSQILHILGKVPRQMLLLLKLNDCLRHIGHVLESSPTNTLVVAGHYASRALYLKSSNNDWLTEWYKYTRIQIRIQLYQWSLWWRNLV